MSHYVFYVSLTRCCPLDCSVPCALEAASLHPAQVLREDSKGRLNIGYDADIVFLSEDLSVQATVIGGEVVWRRTDEVLPPLKINT